MSSDMSTNNNASNEIVVYNVNKNKEKIMQPVELKKYLEDVKDIVKHRQVIINRKYKDRIRIKLDNTTLILRCEEIVNFYSEFIPDFSFSVKITNKW